MAKADLTAERLRELLDYDPETGLLTYRVDRRNGSKAGDVAGWTAQRGIRVIEVDQKNYKAHRLAWLHVNGSWPQGDIDHINGDPADNRLVNLRDVPHLLNLQNRRKPRSGSKAGILGAQWDAARGKWKSSIRAQGKVTHLGRFDTAEEAQQAYLHAKRRLHDGCTI